MIYKKTDNIAALEFLEAKLRIQSISGIVVQKIHRANDEDFEDLKSVIKARSIFILNQIRKNNFTHIADFIFSEYSNKTSLSDREFLSDNWKSIYDYVSKYTEMFAEYINQAFKRSKVDIEEYEQLEKMFLSIGSELNKGISSSYIKTFEDAEDFLSIIVNM